MEFYETVPVIEIETQSVLQCTFLNSEMFVQLHARGRSYVITNTHRATLFYDHETV